MRSHSSIKRFSSLILTHQTKNDSLTMHIPIRYYIFQIENPTPFPMKTSNPPHRHSIRLPLDSSIDASHTTHLQALQTENQARHVHTLHRRLSFCGLAIILAPSNTFDTRGPIARGASTRAMQLVPRDGHRSSSRLSSFGGSLFVFFRF